MSREVHRVLLAIVATSLVVSLCCCCCSSDWRENCDTDCPVIVQSCPTDNVSDGFHDSCTTVCCQSLACAIGHVQQSHHNVSVTLLLSSLCSFRLTGSNNTVNNSNVKSLYLSGNSSVVNCFGEASIVFSGHMNVTIENMSFNGCNGTLQFKDLFGCNITLTHLHLNQSSLSFINVTGYVSISSTNITNLKNPISALYITSQLSSNDRKLCFHLINCNISCNTHGNKVTANKETTRGAGMYISLKKTKNTNKINISNCTFAHNKAYLGGSISVEASAAGEISVGVYNSVFEENEGDIGSAIDFYCIQTPVHKQIRESCLRVVICNSMFTKNEPFTQIIQTHSSTVSIKHTELELNGRIVFDRNNGSGIKSDESDISVNRSTILHFTGNFAQRGAGLNLLGSFVHIYRNTHIIFTNNTAILAGGAIYSNQRLDLYIKYSRDCFVQYDDLDCGHENSCNPDNWNTSLTFNDNTALDGNDIFTVSIFPCMWKNPSAKNGENISNTFCDWKSWHINCSEGDIATSPWKFHTENYTLKGVISGAPMPYKSLRLSVVDEFQKDVTDRTVFTMLKANSSNSLIVAPNYHGNIAVFGEGPQTEKWYIQTIGERTVTAAMEIHMIACPPGFIYDAGVNDCMCNNRLHEIVHCLTNKTAEIEVAYCISSMGYGSKKIFYGRCIFTTGKSPSSSISNKLPRNNDDVDEFCTRINRAGLLCGNCIANHSVDVFSDSFQCEKCSGSILDWSIYVMVESLPVFALFTAVVALHLSLTSGPVNGYIFCCQVVTVTIEVIFTKTSLQKTGVRDPEAMTNFLLIPSNIWSLDFFRIYKLFADKRPTCLGSNLKVMHLLALRYLSAFYPLLFLIITYVLIELHARNCRCLVRLWNPVGYIVSRFRRTWNIRTSLVDAFAAFILLSYVKIIRVSLLLSTHNTVHNMNGKVVRNVLHYDPTITFASHVHIPFMVLGLFLLLTFGLFFPLLLLFYQFHFLQRCLHRLKMNRNGLRIFMDAFQGCYKDGKNNGPDRRFFAGLYFVFRLLVFGTFNAFWNNKELYITLQSLMILFALVTAVLRPYKKELYNTIDTLFFCVLGVAFGLHVYVFDKAETNLKIPDSAVYAAYALELIPFVYVVCYMGVWIGKRVISNMQCRYGALYAPIDNSISWRFNDTEEITSLVPSAQTNNKFASNTSLSLSSSLQGKSEQQRRRSTVSTSLVDTSSYGSIQD